MTEIPELQKEQWKIDQAIMKELLALIPEGWFQLMMQAEVMDPEGDSLSLKVHISNPQVKNSNVTPSEEIYSKLYALCDLVKQHGGSMKGMTYRLNWMADREKWKFNGEFTY